MEQNLHYFLYYYIFGKQKIKGKEQQEPGQQFCPCSPTLICKSCFSFVPVNYIANISGWKWKWCVHSDCVLFHCYLLLRCFLQANNQCTVRSRFVSLCEPGWTGEHLILLSQANCWLRPTTRNSGLNNSSGS